MTTDGRLWHRLALDPVGAFGDIEAVGVGQNVGNFTAVSCS